MLTSKTLSGGKGDFETIPEGPYTAQILDVENTILTFKGESKPGYKYMFAILDDDKLPESGDSVRGRRLWWSVSDSIGKRANLNKLATCALKRELTDVEMDVEDPNCFDPESIVGMQVMVSVENKEYNDRMYSNIKAVFKVKAELEKIDFTPEVKTVKEVGSKTVATTFEKKETPSTPVDSYLDDLDGEIIEEVENDTLDEIVEELTKEEPRIEGLDTTEEDAELKAMEKAAKEAQERLEALKQSKKSK